MYDAHLLREILDAQLEMLCRFRRDGTILFVNRAYAETLGKTPAELTGKTLCNSSPRPIAARSRRSSAS